MALFYIKNAQIFRSSVSQDENRCFPCGVVVDKEIITKICCLIRGIESESYLPSWLVGGRRATQGAATTAIRKEGLLLHLQAGILGKAVGFAIAPPYLLYRSHAALWLVGPFWALLLGLLAKPFCCVDLWGPPGGRPISQWREVFSPFTSLEVSSMDNDIGNGSQNWGVSFENDVMPEVPDRAYSAVLMSGVHDGSTSGSSAHSAQPAIIRYGTATLKDVTANNEPPNHPCSLYFKYAKSAFDLRSLLQDVKKIGISVASVRCVQKVPSDAYNITFTTSEERRLFYEKSNYVSRSADAVYTVYIYDAPCELPDGALVHRLSQYGEVKKIIRRTYSGYGHLETGIRIA